MTQQVDEKCSCGECPECENRAAAAASRAPDTAHLGEPYAHFKLLRNELTLWQQDPFTYPFLWKIQYDTPDVFVFASGCALVDSDSDCNPTPDESVRVLQHVQDGHVALDSSPREYTFLVNLVFAACCSEIADGDEPDEPDEPEDGATGELELEPPPLSALGLVLEAEDQINRR